MYKSHFRIGRVISVYGCHPRTGTSAMAALTATALAAHGEKTLLITTDIDIPDDAVSILSSDITSSHLDSLVVLENSNGLTDENLSDYVVSLTENLWYLRATSPISSLTKDPAKTLKHIVDVACYDFAYVVLDLNYMDATRYASPILEHSDLVLLTLGQDHKSLLRAKDIYLNKGFSEDQFLVPVITGYVDGMLPSIKHAEKLINADQVFQVDWSNDVADMAYNGDLANYMTPRPKHRSFFGRKEEDAEQPTYTQVNKLCILIQNALHPQETKKGDVTDGNS